MVEWDLLFIKKGGGGGKKMLVSCAAKGFICNLAVK